MSDDAQAAANTDEENNKIISPQKIYLKDVSFETPHSPEIFMQDWDPQLGIEVESTSRSLEDDTYEVVLTVTATVSVGDQTAFLAEVHQAGIFILKGFDPERIQRLQKVYCLNTLYPYACAAVSELVSKGGFPQLLLRHINFQGLYMQNLEEARRQAADAVSAPQ